MCSDFQHYEEFIAEKESKIILYKKYISLIDAGEIRLSLVPMDRFYKINWADNDII